LKTSRKENFGVSVLNLTFNPNYDDDARRAQLFSGMIFLNSLTNASQSICEFARDFVKKSFGARDPQHAQDEIPVEEFISIVAPMKQGFTNSQHTKELISAYLLEQGVDAEKTYFDVPRIRVVPHSNYLTAGVAYAYKPHRDIWYSSPLSQINWWMPVWDVTVERSMAFYPSYWDRAVLNTSSDFDYDEWVRVGRAQAVSQVGEDVRKHPVPNEPIDRSDEFRYAARTGDAIVFSAAHLHATVPNTSGATRFSIDFRTLNLDDLKNNRGPKNVDSRARGSTLRDFLRVSDFSPLII
jgi:hypothetical protein